MEKSYPASTATTHRGLTGWPFQQVFHDMPGFFQWHNNLLWALCWYDLPDVPPEWVDIIYITSGEVVSGKGYRYLQLFTVCLETRNQRSSQGLAWGGVCQRECKSESTSVLVPALPPSPTSLQYLFSSCHSLICKIRLMMFSFPGTD